MKKHLFLPAFLLFGLSSCTTQAQNTGHQNLDVAAFKQKMTEPGTVLLDVRTPEETAEGTMEGATKIDFNADDFEAEIGKLDKSKTYLVYCQGGGRSSKACKLMAKKGFKSVYNLEGGYAEWAK